MKKAMFTASMEPIFDARQVAALRIFFAALFLIPFGIGKIKQITARQWLFLFISGVVGTSIPAFLFTEAQQHIDSALAGMLNALTPLFTFIMGVTVFGVAFRKTGLVGVLIGLVGALGLVYFRIDGPVAVNGYALLVVLATLCYGTNINVIKTYLSNMPSLVISSLSLMVVMPLAGLYSLYLDAPDVISQHPEGKLAFFYILVLALFSTSVGLILFNMLIKKVSALFASSVTYFIPIAAIGWGLVDGEKVSLIQIGFIALILVGVWYVNRKSTALKDY